MAEQRVTRWQNLRRRATSAYRTRGSPARARISTLELDIVKDADDDQWCLLLARDAELASCCVPRNGTCSATLDLTESSHQMSALS